MLITIPKNVLKAVSLAMAQKDIRFYLNGVCLSVTDGKAYLVAADGSRLHAVSLGKIPETGTFDAIIPAAAVSSILKLKVPRLASDAIELEIKGDSFGLTVAGQTIGGKLIDSRFPDWLRMVPSADGEALNHTIEIEYLADVLAAVNLIEGAKYRAISMTGEPGGAAVFHRGSFCAVVMPLRGYPRVQVSDAGEWGQNENAAYIPSA